MMNWYAISPNISKNATDILGHSFESRPMERFYRYPRYIPVWYQGTWRLRNNILRTTLCTEDGARSTIPFNTWRLAGRHIASGQILFRNDNLIFLWSLRCSRLMDLAIWRWSHRTIPNDCFLKNSTHSSRLWENLEEVRFVSIFGGTCSILQKAKKEQDKWHPYHASFADKVSDVDERWDILW